jgi:peptide deformylase
MAVREVLLLGNPKLYEISEPGERDELKAIAGAVSDLHDTLIDFRTKHNAGRAIAAPQIGVMKRLVYLYIDTPVVFINPVLDEKSKEMIELWDDCMSFPDLLVKVKRHKSCTIKYRDMAWKQQAMTLEDDLSELLQHECDHLDGILAVARAIDHHSFALKSQGRFLRNQDISTSS